jgi:MFS family permease
LSQVSQRETEVVPTSKGKFSRIPPNVVLLIVAFSINAMGFNYLMVYITAYMPALGVSAGDVGWLLGAEGLTMMLVGIPFGLLSDRRGRKKIMIGGALGIAPILFIFALTSNLLYLVVACIIAGVVEGAFLTTANAVLADMTVREIRDAAFALSFILATAIGGLGFAFPFAFPWLSSAIGVQVHTLHNDALLIFGFVSILTALAIWRILRTYKESPRPSELKHLRTILKFSGSNSIIGLGAGFIIPLIPTWFYLKLGVPDSISGPLLAVASVTMGLAAILSPKMASRFGFVRTIVFNQGLSTVFMLSLAFVGDPILAGLLYVFRAALMNMSSPLSDTLLMSIVAPEERGLASAINGVVWRFPNSITTIIGGYILKSGDFSLPFFLATGFYVLGITCFYAMFKDASLVS